jgi:hypothetical protein
MSCSQCIKCEAMVSGYQKYCDNCVRKYGVQQDEMFHKTFVWVDWNIQRDGEFEKDMAARPIIPGSTRDPETQTAYGLRDVMQGAVNLPLVRRFKSSKNADPDYRKRTGSRPAK